MLFFNGAKLSIYGNLKAIGTLQDSIIFTKLYLSSNWNGIKFYNSANNILKYTIISKAHTGLNDGVIRDDNSEILIENSIIKDNFKSTYRAAIYTIGTCNLIINNTEITNNTNAFYLYNNSASNVVVTNTDISYNDYAIYNMSANPTFNKCSMHDNYKLFYTDNGTSNSTVINSMLYRNDYITSRGRTSITFKNSIIFSNGTVFNDNYSFYNFHITLQNSIVYFNAIVFSLGSAYNPIINTNHNLFYGNNSLDTNYQYNLGILDTINANGDSTDTYGNLFMNPLLVDTANGDYHLSFGSPCIDAGNNYYVTTTTDYDGDQRVFDGNGDNNSVVDIGPYEYQFTQAAFDAGIISLSTSSPCSGTQNVTAQLRNFGTDSLHSIKIDWEINNIQQPPYIWNGGMASGDSTTIVLDNAFNPQTGNNYDIKAYISLINNVLDSVHFNDTIYLNKIFIAPTSLSFSALGSVCVDSNSIILNTATPTGGYYSGDGVSNQSFNPAQAGVGSHNITYTYIDSNQCANQISASIIVNALPTLNFSNLNDSSYCHNDIPVALSAFPSGGSFNGNGLTDSLFYPDSLSAGNYALNYSYTDANGCSNTDTLNITIYENPTVNLSTFSNVCANQNSLTLSGGLPLGGSYQGIGVDSISSIFHPDSVGVGLHSIIYSYTDQHNCVNSDTQYIRVISIPQAVISISATACKGASVQISSIGQHSATANYSWAFDNANILTGNSSGPYSVSWDTAGVKLISLTVSDSSCSSQPVYSYTNVLEVQALATLISNDSACFGDSILLSAYQGGNYTFQWYDSLNLAVGSLSNSQNFYAQQSGQYYVKTSNSFGCNSNSNTITTYINPLITSDFSIPATACKNALVGIQYTGISGNNAVFNWNFGNGTIASGSGAGPYNILWNTDSIKTVNLYVSENNCNSDITVHNLMIESPTAFITSSQNTNICNGDSLALSANSGNYNYLWYKNGNLLNDTNSIYFANSAGLYSVSITDKANLCSDLSDTISVIVNTTDFNLAFSANQTNFNIPPFNVQFVNQTPNVNDYFYHWSMGDGTSSISINPNHQYAYDGDYSVNLLAQNINTGCFDTLNKVDFIHCTGGSPNPCSIDNSIGHIGSSNICPDDSTKLFSNEHDSVGVNFQWLKGGVIIPGATDSIYYAHQTGLYQLMLSDSICTVFSQPFALTQYTTITPTILSQGSIQACTNDSLELYTSTSYSNYQWSNGSISPSIFIHNSGTYTLTVTDANSCQSTSIPYILNASAIPPPNICIVGIDSLGVNNQVVWERHNSNATDSFRIYRETNVAGIYTAISTQAFASPSIFTDSSSNPAQQAYRYRITAIDTCGTETSFSQAHKTIHLTINSGLGGVWNLIWNHYEGFNFGSYRIYRGTDSTQMTLLTQIQSTINSFTDLNPPVGIVYYQIEILSPHPCYPDSIYSKANTNYNISRSNTANTNMAPNIGFVQAVGNSLNLRLYPNPNKGQFTLEISSNSHKPQDYQLEIYSVMGKLIHQEQISGGTSITKQMHLETLSKGIYFIWLRNNDEVLNGKFVVE
jgi:hypothetical protein